MKKLFALITAFTMVLFFACQSAQDKVENAAEAATETIEETADKVEEGVSNLLSSEEEKEAADDAVGGDLSDEEVEKLLTGK